MTNHHDAPPCPHGHGKMQEMEWGQGPYYIAWRCVDPTCGAIGEAFLLAQEYERGRQEERERLVAVMREADNHHNALLCPYCNPDGIDPQAERERAEAAEARVRELEKALQEIQAGPQDPDWWEDIVQSLKDKGLLNKEYYADNDVEGISELTTKCLAVWVDRRVRFVLSNTCPDCGTPLKAKLPEHPGATGYHYCPNEACPLRGK